MYVTLNIGASSLRLLSVAGGRVRRWAEMPLEPGLVKDGLIVRSNAVAAAINALFESAGVSRKRVITSLSGLSFTYRQLRLPRVKGVLQEETIMREARKEMSLPLEDLYVSWQPTGYTADTIEVFILGVPRTAINSVAQTLEEAGIRPYAVDLRGLALGRVANRAEAVVVSLEPGCFDIVVVAAGAPAILHTMIPRGEGASLEDNLARLSDELTRTIEFYGTLHAEAPLDADTPLLLTGELSTDPAVGSLIQATTGYAVEPLLSPLRLPPDLPVAAYTTNIGLAMKKMPRRHPMPKGKIAYRDINLNLLSAKYTTESLAAKTLRILVSTLLAVSVVFAYPTYQVKLRADARTEATQAELERANRLLHEARVATDEANQIEERINQLSAVLAALRQGQAALGQRGQAARDLAVTTEALTAVRLMSMEIDTDRIVLAGEAGSATAVISYVSALENAGSYSEVRIAELNITAGSDPDEATSPGASFTIVITR